MSIGPRGYAWVATSGALTCIDPATGKRALPGDNHAAFEIFRADHLPEFTKHVTNGLTGGDDIFEQELSEELF